jgi:hypothetical protein
MKTARVVTLLGLCAMAGALTYGFVVGDLGDEGRTLLSMPWGIVSLIDVYVGFALFSCWVVYRERSLVRSVAWIAFIVVLGSFTASLYALLALLTCGGDWQRFWLGRRLPPSPGGAPE